MNKQLKLWEEYKRFVAKKNKPIMEHNSKEIAVYFEEIKKINKAMKEWCVHASWDRVPMRLAVPPYLLTLYEASYEGFMDWQLENKK